MMYSIIIIFLLFIGGLIQETLLITYHRALSKNTAFLAASLTTIIWIISIFVMTEIIRLIHTTHSWMSLALIASFASGKFTGAYLSIKNNKGKNDDIK